MELFFDLIPFIIHVRNHGTTGQYLDMKNQAMKGKAHPRNMLMKKYMMEMILKQLLTIIMLQGKFLLSQRSMGNLMQSF